MTSGSQGNAIKTEIDAALEDLAARSQALVRVYEGGFPALNSLARHLNLPLEVVEEQWQFNPHPVTGALFDAVTLSRSLSVADREQYLRFLRYSFELPAIYLALSYQTRHYWGGSIKWPNLGYDAPEISVSASLEAEDVLDKIALTPNPSLREHMPTICNALLAEDHQFFRSLQRALDWEQRDEMLTCGELAALPEGKRPTQRTTIRRFWVSRGLWLMRSDVLLELFPSLSASANDKLTAIRNDHLTRNAVYTRIDAKGKIRDEGVRAAPSISSSLLTLHLQESC